MPHNTLHTCRGGETDRDYRTCHTTHYTHAEVERETDRHYNKATQMTSTKTHDDDELRLDSMELPSRLAVKLC